MPDITLKIMWVIPFWTVSPIHWWILSPKCFLPDIKTKQICIMPSIPGQTCREAKRQAQTDWLCICFFFQMVILKRFRVIKLMIWQVKPAVSPVKWPWKILMRLFSLKPSCNSHQLNFLFYNRFLLAIVILKWVYVTFWIRTHKVFNPWWWRIPVIIFRIDHQ